MAWKIRSVGYQEDFVGEVSQPLENYFSRDLIIYFDTLSAKDVGDFGGLVRGYKNEPLIGTIFSAPGYFNYGEYQKISIDLDVPFNLQISLKRPTAIQRYSYFIYEQASVIKTNNFDVNNLNDSPQQLLPVTLSRDSILIVNKGAGVTFLSFDGGQRYLIELKPGYSASFEPGTLDSIWAFSPTVTAVTITEVTIE